jgi:3-hydroxyisobutyrate dehydrogenase-like beta-hydroxyacid dehydrogenase
VAAAESRTLCGRLAPGIGATVGDFASSQASVTCWGLVPRSCATRWKAAYGPVLSAGADGASSELREIPPSGLVLTSPVARTRSRAAAAWAAERSIAYLDGAVMVPTPLIGSPDALLFYSGAPEAFERYESTLKVLGGKAAYVGTDPGLAALYDLSLLDFFYGSISGLVHAYALATADGVKAVDIAPYLSTIVQILPPIAEYTAANIDAGSYPGAQANLGMMAAGVEHILHAARTRGLDVSHLESIKSVADRAIAKGHGSADWASTIEALTDRT